MAIHFTRTTTAISDLTLHLKHAKQAGPEQMEQRTTFFPAEWHPQCGVQLTWPHAGTDWAPLLDEVTDCYVQMAFEIALREQLLIVTPEPDAVCKLLHERLPARVQGNIHYFECPTNDTWARDHGFLTLVTEQGPRLLDFCFNGWGEKFPADLDNAINAKLFKGQGSKDNVPSSKFQVPSSMFSGHYEDHLDFVLEGGSIESDGTGTLLTTASCLLAPHRNQPLTRIEIEERLLRWFHADRLIWLEHGRLEGDDTDGHIDTLARFCPGGIIVYVQCTDPAEPQYAELHAMEEELQALTVPGDSIAGSAFTLLPLPMPEPIFDPDDGHRLPATYANFLIINGAVLMPTYGQPENDDRACRQLQKAFPKHEIIPIDSRVLIRQHGSIHCCTMQFPVGAWKMEGTMDN